MKKPLQVALSWFLCIATISVAAEKAPQYQHYVNRRFSYCINFHKTWQLSESMTQNGVTLTPKSAEVFAHLPRISVGAHANQPSQDGRHPQTLDENIQAVVESLKEYGSAENIQVLDQHTSVLQGLPAKTITLRFSDRRSNSEWFLKDANLIDAGNVVYFIELRCHPKDAVILEPIFDELVQSLHIQCKSHSSGRTGATDSGPP